MSILLRQLISFRLSISLFCASSLVWPLVACSEKEGDIISATDRCAVGTSPCGGVCFHLSSAPDHCGGCDVACPSEQSCSAGSCVSACTAGETSCSRACVELSSNPAHCGACGAACQGGQLCKNGACESEIETGVGGSIGTPINVEKPGGGGLPEPGSEPACTSNLKDRLTKTPLPIPRADVDRYGYIGGGYVGVATDDGFLVGWSGRLNSEVYKASVTAVDHEGKLLRPDIELPGYDVNHDLMGSVVGVQPTSRGFAALVTSARTVVNGNRYSASSSTLAFVEMDETTGKPISHEAVLGPREKNGDFGIVYNEHINHLLATENGYVAYMYVDKGGHQGNHLAYLNPDGTRQEGGWGWGCSHDFSIQPFAINDGHLATVCFSDVNPHPWSLNFSVGAHPLKKSPRTIIADKQGGFDSVMKTGTIEAAPDGTFYFFYIEAPSGTPMLTHILQDGTFQKWPVGEPGAGGIAMFGQYAGGYAAIYVRNGEMEMKRLDMAGQPVGDAQRTFEKRIFAAPDKSEILSLWNGDIAWLYGEYDTIYLMKLRACR